MKVSSVAYLLSLGSTALASASNNYTDYLLSSGTIKLGVWQSAYDRASSFVSTLTTAEKISIISGGDAGDFSAMAMLDSSSNPLTYYYVTTWPAGLAMAMTWNQSAIEGQGNALGAEYKGKGINLAYAPTLEPLGRSAWCGRTGETYGPDSYFAGKMGGRFVKVHLRIKPSVIIILMEVCAGYLRCRCHPQRKALHPQRIRNQPSGLIGRRYGRRWRTRRRRCTANQATIQQHDDHELNLHLDRRL